ncbi:unnamed protein product, partial [Brassica napus]
PKTLYLSLSFLSCFDRRRLRSSRTQEGVTLFYLVLIQESHINTESLFPSWIKKRRRRIEEFQLENQVRFQI